MIFQFVGNLIIGDKLIFIIWLINIKYQLEKKGINYNFALSGFYRVTANNETVFMYKTSRELYCINNNIQYFLLNKKLINWEDNLSDLYSTILKLMNIENIDNVFELNLGQQQKLLLYNILRYCSKPLNQNITLADLKFIIYIYT